MKKLNKEQCEIEFKRYNEKFLKSLANFETYNKEKKEMEKITSENLLRLESKVNEGYRRAIEKKEKVRYLASLSLSKIEEVKQ